MDTSADHLPGPSVDEHWNGGGSARASNITKGVQHVYNLSSLRGGGHMAGVRLLSTHRFT